MNPERWNRDEKQLRTLTPKEHMKEVIDNKWWGLLLKLVLTMVSIFVPILATSTAYIYNTINHHSNQLENLYEWRRGHETRAESEDRRIISVEESVHQRAIEIAVLKDNIPRIYQSTTETSAKLTLLNEQMDRYRKDISDLQSRFESIKSKN